MAIPAIEVEQLLLTMNSISRIFAIRNMPGIGFSIDNYPHTINELRLQMEHSMHFRVLHLRPNFSTDNINFLL